MVLGFNLLLSYYYGLKIDITIILNELCKEKRLHNKIFQGVDYIPTYYCNGIILFFNTR